MQICSVYFLFFLGIIALVNYILPGKARPYWLLAANMVFYASYNIWYLPFLWLGILITFVGARALETRDEGKKTVLTIVIVLILAELGYLKYTGLIGGTIHDIQKLATGSSDFRLESIIIPVGISYYLMKTIGYVVDVYRGRVSAENNLLHYALFVSFFPTLVSGPIERAGEMLPQYRMPSDFDEDTFRRGMCRIIWGFFMKMIVADRIGILVNTVNSDPAFYRGTVVFIAVLLYSLQVYSDFAGYSNIAFGSAMILGYRVPDNFEGPFLAGTVGELWRRWHISLSSWLRDYVYIPLGGNRKGRIRKYRNIMITFLVSGLWHGSGWTYVVWGGLNGLFQVIGLVLKPFRDRFVHIFRIDRQSFSHRILKTFATFMLFSLSMIFFGKESFREAFTIIRNMWDFTPWVLTDGTFYRLGLDRPNMNLMLCGIVVIFIADIFRYRGISLSEKVSRQSLWLRWLIYLAAIVLIAVCGSWGRGYDASSFIYVQF